MLVVRDVRAFLVKELGVVAIALFDGRLSKWSCYN
jgi:hypothetical protein